MKSQMKTLSPVTAAAVILLMSILGIAWMKADRLPPLGLSAEDSLQFHRYFQRADSMMLEEQYDSAWHFALAAQQFEDRGNDSLRLLLEALQVHIKGNQKVGENQLDSALVYFKIAEERSLKLARWKRVVLARLDQALVHYMSGRYAEMEAPLLAAEQAAKAHLPPDFEYVPFIYLLKGVTYSQTGDYDKSIAVNRQSLEYTRQYAPEEVGTIFSLYNNLGVNFKNKGDYDRAIEYYLAGMSMKEAEKETRPTDFLILFDNLSQAYGRKRNYAKALFFNQRILEILRKTDAQQKYVEEFFNALNNRGVLFTEMGNFDSAFVYLQRALELEPQLVRREGDIYHNLAYLFRKKGQYSEAIDYYQQAISIAKEQYASGHPILARHHRHLGEAYRMTGALDKALEKYQQSLVIMVPSFTDTSYLDNPSLVDYNSATDLLKTLRDKGKALAQQSARAGGRQYLEVSLSTLQLAADLVDSLRNEYQEGSQQFWNEEVRPVFEEGIAVAVRLYREEGDTRYLNKAFRFAEKSKAALLAAAVQESAARRQAGIPEEILNREKSLKLDIAFYREKIFREQQKEEKADTSKMLLWQGKILDKREAYETLLKQLEKNYPTYYDLKYRESVAGITDIQETLPSGEILVEYFLGEEQLFVFTIDQASAQVRVFERTSGLEETLQAFLDPLRDRQLVAEEGLSPELFNTYITQSTSLYDQLLKPVLSEAPERMVIIPDGLLSYLPFELLLTKAPPAGRKVDYAALPYLLRRSRVRYEYSATLMMQPFKKKKISGSFAGFAPAYGSDLLASARDAQVFCGDVRDAAFGNLSNNQSEVSGIAKLLRGSSYIAEAATEAAFKELADEQGILHLAMHGFVNECDPLYSGLVFTQTKGEGTAPSRSGAVLSDSLATAETFGVNDGFLHAYEIYNLQLDAELAVLSACNTGSGQLARGEGVMSLARAFKYAGCPNIVTSLWQADDAATAQIMDSFYRFLKEGDSKDEALRQAKLNYLDSNRRNHPFFWGTFILIGDDRPIDRPVSWGPTLLLGFLALLSLGGGLFWWRRHQRIRG